MRAESAGMWFAAALVAIGVLLAVAGTAGSHGGQSDPYAGARCVNAADCGG